MNLAKSAFLIGISYFVKIFSGLVINKILAIFVGPSGIALIGQYRNFVQMMTMLSTGGINSGVVKLIASHKSDEHQIVKNISVSIGLICSLILALSIFFFSEYISIYLFSVNSYDIYIKIFSMALLFFSINQIFLFFINGEGNTSLYTCINILQSLTVLTLSIIFVILYHLDGAFLVIGISQGLVFFISFYYVKKFNIFSFKNYRFLIKSKISKVLFSYSIITIVNIISVSLSLILIRQTLISKFGETQTGYWQAVWNISEFYLGFVTMFLSIYFYPRISSLLKSKNLLKQEIRLITFFVAIISLIVIFLMYFLKEWIILTLYSKEFLKAIIFFKWQLVGDFIKIMSWIFGYYMLSVRATKLIIVSTILSNFLFVLLTNILTSRYGILGVNYAYVVVYIGFLILSIFFYRYNNES